MERWQQIESLFQEALERDPAERNAWLREACQGDSDLRREVASLLANHQPATNSQPWAEAAAAELIDEPASLDRPVSESLSCQLQPDSRLGAAEKKPCQHPVQASNLALRVKDLVLSYGATGSITLDGYSLERKIR
jgi:hypothetical protein